METIDEFADALGVSRAVVRNLAGIELCNDRLTGSEPIPEKVSDYLLKKFDRKAVPATSAKKPTGDTAPGEHREQFQHNRGNTTMTTDDDFYDEHATDAESTKQWEQDPNIRAEFHSDYESFKHFRRAESQGLIRILGSK